MNAEAIMTPGGIADQLTRGLSGLGQSFNRREEMLRQGQRDRIGDDRYTAEMALRERDRQQQIDRQNMLDQRDANSYSDGQTRQSARDALGDRRNAEEDFRRKATDDRINADADLNRQTQHPELYQNSPNLQTARTAQEALGRKQFSDAKQGYIPQDQMQILPEQQDWRVPMNPGEPLYGPKPGTPAWQGQRAGDVLRESKTNWRLTPDQRMAEIAAKGDEARRTDQEKPVNDKSLNPASEARKNIKTFQQQIDSLVIQEAALDDNDPRLPEIRRNRSNLEGLIREQMKIVSGSGAPAGPFNSGNIEDDIANGAPSFKP